MFNIKRVLVYYYPTTNIIHVINVLYKFIWEIKNQKLAVAVLIHQTKQQI